MKTNKLIHAVVCFTLCLAQSTQAENKGVSGGPQILTEDLVIGTGDIDGVTLNDIFAVETQTGESFSLIPDVPFWGAAYDPVGNRIIYTTSGGKTDGADLAAIDVITGISAPLGTITANAEAIRIDGLAFSKGVLYGVQQFDSGSEVNPAGLYVIDLNSLEATFNSSVPSGDISGIGADPSTGIIYAANDGNSQVVQLDLDGTITNIAAYPEGYFDIDGLAVGYGTIYLITDEAQDIALLDLATLTYDTPITSPIANEDTFSGGAFVHDVIFADQFEN